ncbi:uncharacterized protein LOC118480275 [Helianthus annuus]|uniref:uncharacterized protein LOC118480275 n=1 Tax=Helianthus annuus TaxID=4232 RepID=UPI001652D226|nr:uncharacterized protein LOC118480275 [Helianthus annuus]
MRVTRSTTSPADKEAALAFSKWLLDIGDGLTGVPYKQSPDTKIIDIPTQFLIQPGENGLHQLIKFIYDDDILHNPTASNLSERAIVCPKNETADEINELVLASSPGECSTYLSVDSITPHSHSQGDTDLMKDNMQEGRISSIVPAGPAIPIKIRVIRKWQPRLRNSDMYYFFIDKHGDGIQASVHWLDKELFERKITLFSCYLLEKYICDDQPTPPRVNSHIASIRMGTKASLTLIPTPDAFPMYYFNFCPYSDLSLRTGDDQELLTDYLAKLEYTTPGTTKKGREYLRLRLTDISGEHINATLWEEVLPKFDKQAMLAAEQPIIVALTSVCVSTFNDRVQLASTIPTHIYFNPDIEAATAIRNRFYNFYYRNENTVDIFVV